MKLAIVLGTRPEIIKMASIIWECEKKGYPYFILHTGQHYSPKMDTVFFRNLRLKSPRYNLKLGAGLPYEKQIGLFTERMLPIMAKEKPSVVVVQGDTTSVLAGAMAASRLEIPCAHHEAGLRSFDLLMREEVHRIITDHISDFLFAPTIEAAANLRAEELPENRIYLVGNTVADVVKRYKTTSARKILAKHKLKPRRYFLVTAHRAENTDNRERLENILEGLDRLGRRFPDTAIVYPIHPRTKLKIKEFGLRIPTAVQTTDPIDYFSMMPLMKNAKLLLTDSGGIQEEGCLLHVPVVTLRDNTERPETVRAKVNVLVPGVAPDAIVSAVESMLSKKHHWISPYGEGDAGKKIVQHLKHLA